MTYIARLKASDFLSIINCASTEEVRYYLQGVHLSRDLKAVATDGHLMGVRNTSGAFRSESLEECIIPAHKDLVKACKPHKTDPIDSRYIFVKEDNSIEVALVDDTNDDLQACEVIAGFPTIKLIDGNYPDWRRVIPNDAEIPGGETVFPVFDMRVLNRIAPAGKKFFSFQMLHNRNAGAACVIRPADTNLFFVIMAVRADSQNGLPPWMKESTE